MNQQVIISPLTDPAIQYSARWNEGITHQFRERNPWFGCDDPGPGEHVQVYLWWTCASNVGQGMLETRGIKWCHLILCLSGKKSMT